MNITHAQLVTLAFMGAPGLSREVYDEAGRPRLYGESVPWRGAALNHGDEVDRRARQHAQKEGITYRQALHDVLDADPGLKAAYAAEVTRPSWITQGD